MTDFLKGKGFVIVPRITTTERNALTPANGMLVYDTTLNAFYKYENGAWSAFAGGGASWGSITGTLSSQTDLQTAFDGKANTVHTHSISDVTGLTSALSGKQDALGYTAENTANKTDAMTGNTGSSTKYLSAKGVYDWVVSLGYITTAALSGYLTSATAALTYQVILTAANLGSLLNGFTSKTTPVDADSILLSDSEATNTGKKLTWANLKATLKTYFDTLYTNATYVDDRYIFSNRANRWEYFLDFESNPSGNFSSEDSNFSGVTGGAFTAVATTGSNTGIVSADTGTGTAGGAIVGTSTTVLLLGTGEAYAESLIQIPTLSIAGQRFKVFTGFLDVLTAVSDGVYITYSDNENSGNWVFSCSSGGTTTSFNLSSGPVAGTWYKIGVLINAAGTSARCYINGVEPSGAGYPITSNIPTGASNQTGLRTGILKSAGTTSRSLYIDFLYGRIKFTTPR